MIKRPLNQRVLFIVGPTGSGKSAFAFALAKKVRGEILSADSMQVYKGMNIGTDKPPASMRRSIRHHLLDVVDPTEEFSVYDYRKRVFHLLEEINRRGKLPIVVGGTGLYVKAIVDGISPQPGKDERVREALRSEARTLGTDVLYGRLKREDPLVATRVHPHDEKRIVRALEVLEVSGKKLSEWEKKTQALADLGYSYWIVGIRRNRGDIYRRIDERVDQMFQRGLLKEAQKIYRKPLSLTARQAVGYRELFDHLEGRLSLEKARDLIKQHTRNLAKRQITWFKKDSRIRWLGDTGREALDAAVRMIQEV